MTTFNFPIIPKPAKMQTKNGTFFTINRTFLTQSNLFLAPEKNKILQELLNAVLPGKHTAQFKDMPNGQPINLRLDLDPTCCDGKAEASILNITPSMIHITATDSAGLFYAVQTLVQLIENAQHDAAIPCCTITDYPRYVWRGFMLDSARHFQPVSWIKQHIDRMAKLKLNRLHWHLCDDQAWRAEVLAYPKLTDVAAWRTENGKHYGGYYSQQQMREIVQYAKERHITVIPEIEMPGHCNSALVAYPHLSCKGQEIAIGDDGWDAYTQVTGRLPYCAGKPQVYAFLKNVLAEMSEIFPDFLHIGGDETPGSKWDDCPLCSAMKANLNLTTNTQMRNAFLAQIHDHCTHRLNRKTIAWTDGVDAQIPEDQIVHAWFAHEAATAARLGYDVINSNHEWVYLDYPAFEDDRSRKPDWMLTLPLEKVYHFDPTPEGLEREHQQHILGSESPIWTEYAPDAAELERQIFPRLIAFAEVLWSPKLGRSFDCFTKRLAQYQHPVAVKKPVGALVNHCM